MNLARAIVEQHQSPTLARQLEEFGHGTPGLLLTAVIYFLRRLRRRRATETAAAS